MTRKSVAACVGAAVLAFSSLAPVTAQQSWSDVRSTASERHARTSDVFGAWNVEAIHAYDVAQACANAPSSECPRTPCAPVRARLVWLGALCEAEAAEPSGNPRRRTRAIENAHRQLLADLGPEGVAARGIAEDLKLAQAGGADKHDVMLLHLTSVVTEYRAWIAAQTRILLHEAEIASLREQAEAGDARAQFALGLKLYEDRSLGEGRLSEAAQWFELAARQGDADAQRNIGLMLANGWGVPQDHAQAVAWYRRAAEQGHADAQYNLGALYADGRGVPRDDDQAVAWYRHAAEKGHADAQINLGLMYERGNGVPQDDAQAVAWYQRAAEQGHAVAQTNLGWMHANGRGVPRDYDQAFAWYLHAAHHGNVRAQTSLGVMYENGNGVPKDDTQAVTWYRRAAEQGHAVAQYNLGMMYASGHGVPRDDEQAFTWYRHAAEQGHANAQNNLGVMYRNGKGAPQDDAQAVAWYRRAADQGVALAQYNLGVMYENGLGVSQDDVEAAAWYRLAAEQGDTDAQNNLGSMHATGRGGLIQDHTQAAQWYERAARQGHAFSQRNLAWLHWRGHGVEEARVTAYAWMNLAAAAGHPNAPAERDQFARELTSTDVQQGQALARDWTHGQALRVIRATPAAPARTVLPGGGSPRPTQTRSGSRFPAAPPKRPGVVSCNTNCVNSDCYRTYDDGRQVRFQAQRTFRFGEWVWDSGSC